MKNLVLVFALLVTANVASAADLRAFVGKYTLTNCSLFDAATATIVLNNKEPGIVIKADEAESVLYPLKIGKRRIPNPRPQGSNLAYLEEEGTFNGATLVNQVTYGYTDGTTKLQLLVFLRLSPKGIYMEERVPKQTKSCIFLKAR